MLMMCAIPRRACR